MSEKIILKEYGYNIKVKEIENHKSNGLDSSFLTLLFSGKDFNIKLANSIRRVSCNSLPMYAFASDLIKIDTNTSIAFDNDYMITRLANLPVIGIEPKPFFLPEKFWHGVKYSDINREKHETEQQLELHVNYHNTTNKVVPVTTNDCNIYIDGDLVTPYNKKYPILLIKLKPNEKFKCTMKAVLGVGKSHASWDGARNAYYDEVEVDEEIKDDEKKIKLTIEANNQISEYEILVRACKFLIYKISILKDDFEKKIKTKEILDEQIINLKLEQEDHTIGEILNYEFQNHQDIMASGLSKPDHLIRAILIKITATQKNKPLSLSMIESMDILIKKISHIGKLIVDLQKKQK